MPLLRRLVPLVLFVLLVAGFQPRRLGFEPRSGGICGGQNGAGAGFLRVLRLPLPILIPPTASHTFITRGWYNRPNSGRHAKCTESHWSHPTPRNLKNVILLLQERRDRSVGIATGYGLDDQGGGSSSPGGVKNFHFSISSRLALGSTQPPIKMGTVVFPGDNAAGAWSWPLTSN
jgi:hypothetical protein